MVEGLLEFIGISEIDFWKFTKLHMEAGRRGPIEPLNNLIQANSKRYVIPLAFAQHLTEVDLAGNKLPSINGIVVVKGPSFDEIYRLLEKINLGNDLINNF